MRIGFQELIVILLIAGVVFGGSKISGLGKAIGKSVREFKEEVNGTQKKESEEKEGSEK